MCKLLPEPHNQTTYDLLIGEVVGAWADTRVFSDGHWHSECAHPDFRSLHYTSGRVLDTVDVPAALLPADSRWFLHNPDYQYDYTYDGFMRSVEDRETGLIL